MIFFYITTGINKYVSIALMIFSLLAMYALISSIIFLVKELLKKNDELVRKITFNSMTVSFMLILLLHLIQMIVRISYFKKTGNDINLVVTPGKSIYLLGDRGLHLESFGADFGIFGISLFINRLRYRL